MVLEKKHYKPSFCLTVSYSFCYPLSVGAIIWMAMKVGR